MQAALILNSNVLDIIFENRNKLYGAYELRKGYDKRLLTAVGIITSLVSLLVLFSYFKKEDPNTHLSAPLWKIDTVKLVAMPPPPKTVEPKAIERLATVKNPPPLIVKDHLATDTLPTVDEMDKKIIGLKNIDGPLPGEGPQPPTSEIATEKTNVAAPEAPVAPEPAVWEKAEVMPSYPGGVEALRRFLSRHLQVPAADMEPGERVRVPIRFVVNKTGELTDIEFLSPTSDAFKIEIIRVVKKMPKWEPGAQHGKQVSVYFSIPIIFEINE